MGFTNAAASLSEATVAVVGLGLMGGSLAAALSYSQACAEVVGVARRRATLTTARSLQFIRRGETDLAEGVADADLVVLCTPVRDILDKLHIIGPMLKPGCVVIDVGSTKRAICEAMAGMPAHVNPIGGHPMCGKERSGLTMAEPELYRDRTFVLVPLERTPPEALSLAHELVETLGARALELEPERHDRMVAAISHLPAMMATTLVNAAAELASKDPLTWQLAAGGFRDTSRVAGGSVPMMMDILLTNQGPILEAIAQAQAELSAIAESLSAGDSQRLQSLIEAARNKRLEAFP